MNDESLDDELDLGVEKASAPWKKIVIIVFAGLLLIGIGVGVAYFLFVPSDEDKTEEVAKDGEVEEEAEEEKGPAVYQNFKPVFVVNLSPDSNKRKAKMLQIGVQALTHNQELVDFLKHNDPMIRHHFLKLFGTLTASSLVSKEGKEKLQKDLLEELQRIVDEQGGTGTVDAVFFTSFVMQ